MAENPQFKGVNINIPIACDTSKNWRVKNPRIALGVLTLEVDTNVVKVGVGKLYNDTPSVGNGDSLFTPAMKEMLENANRPGGVVVLDENGKFPVTFVDLDPSSIPAGADGKNNYELAQDNGFTGTLDEWLNSLIGPPGPGMSVIRDEPTYRSWGNIPQGISIKGMTFQDYIDKQLYPYMEPSFSAFNANGINTTYEVGYTLPANLTFSYITTNNSNIKPGGFTIKDITNGSIIASNVVSSPTTSSSVEITKTSSGSHVFQIEGIDSRDHHFIQNFTVNFRWKLYYGESDSAMLTQEQIKILRLNSLASGYVGNYNFNMGGYKCIAYPINWGKVIKFIDNETGFEVAMKPPEIITITNIYSVDCSYYLYVTANKFSSSLSINLI